MAKRRCKQSEPQFPKWRIVKRPRVELVRPKLSGEYWDDVIRDVCRMSDDDVMEVLFEDLDLTSTMASGARRAAARAGVRIEVLVRGSAVYISEKRSRDRSKRKK